MANIRKKVKKRNVKTSIIEMFSSKKVSKKTPKAKPSVDVIKMKAKAAVFNVQLAEGVTFQTHAESLEFLRSLQFKVVPFGTFTSIKAMNEKVMQINEERETLTCDIDGAVIKVNDLSKLDTKS